MTTSRDCWLQRSPLKDERLRDQYRSALGRVELRPLAAKDLAGIAENAKAEIESSFMKILGIAVDVSIKPTTGAPAMPPPGTPLPLPGTWRLDTPASAPDLSPGTVRISAASASGILYGTFALISLIERGVPVAELPRGSEPAQGLRMLDHWDNMDGSVERGYAGRSIFFEDGRVKPDLSRVAEYARLLASVGINAAAINNVNVHSAETTLISDPGIREVARVAAVFRAWGIATWLSVNYAAPIQLAGLPVSDPLDPAVAAFWRERANAIYKVIPDFGGFLVKADSEGRPGPFTYGRTHAEGANMLARALAPHGGAVIWRCFVYNCKQDWRDRSTDRARAAYDHFMPLDGQFDSNVFLQIKNGPMDFQVREPVSPLICALQKTRRVLELQVTQEYTGQQRHACFLVPQWKLALDFDTAGNPSAPEPLRERIQGIAAVSNVGMDDDWCGHLFAQANLFGYARLCWNPGTGAREIADEWTALTFGPSLAASGEARKILMQSWPAYEAYTSPLGVGWMVAPNHHYGPDPDGYEYSRWGTYHFADRDGLGVDRSDSGTKYCRQYRGAWADTYASTSTCPDELLLFFHHVAYGHVLHSGKTVIQHVYDSHFEGAEAAADFVDIWKSISAHVDPDRHARALARFEEQAAHAREWRDIVNTYFFRKSGVPDAHGRKIY